MSLLVLGLDHLPLPQNVIRVGLLCQRGTPSLCLELQHYRPQGHAGLGTYLPVWIPGLPPTCGLLWLGGKVCGEVWGSDVTASGWPQFPHLSLELLARECPSLSTSTGRSWAPAQHSPPALHVPFHSSVQSFSRARLCDPMNCSMPGLPVHHQLPEFTQTHVH